MSRTMPSCNTSIVVYVVSPPHMIRSPLPSNVSVSVRGYNLKKANYPAGKGPSASSKGVKFAEAEEVEALEAGL